MTFTTTKLAGNRVLVSGTDSRSFTGETVLDSTEWEAVKAHRAHDAAHGEFDKEVEKFFAPITKAAEKLTSAHTAPQLDEAYALVISAAVEGTPSQDAEVIILGHDAAVLRMLEDNPKDAAKRLVWIDKTLEIISA